jgi:hypothetical protein
MTDLMEEDEAGGGVAAALDTLAAQSAFMEESWATLVNAAPPVDARAETLAFNCWGQDTAAALIRLEPILREAPPKAFWEALIEAAGPRLRAEVLASLRRRVALL